VGRALRRLRGAVSVHALFCCATCVLCESVGFARAAVFSLQGRELVAESVYQDDRGESARAMTRLTAQPFDLGPGLRETEALRRGTTILVEDASADARAIGMLAGAGSFVVAPIICHEQAVGLIHVDRGLSGEAVTELDRDTLAVFAEGFGHALERCVLSGRLRAHSERVLALVRSAEASVTDLGRPEFALRAAPPRSPALRFPGQAAVQSENGLHGLLTRRELEVVAMLAEGETNARIAQRLFVSEDTVKSHVKHILRKLGVHNRSQAVSRYFQARAAT
jgi:LuxR family transcriptional regulator, regulator of acetate metabolism